MIDQIIAHNKEYVANKGYQKHITDKYPDKRLAILTCMDCRLTRLLPEALGLRNGDAKVIKNAGGLIMSPYDSAMRSLIVAIYELGVEEIMVVHHSHCGACHMDSNHMKELMRAKGIAQQTIENVETDINLDTWLDGFHDIETSVRDTIHVIRHHPLIPKDINIRGFVIDSTTGELSEIFEE